MLKLKIEHFDELEDILLNFKLITYLYHLVEDDCYNGSVTALSDGEFNIDCREIYSFLYELLFENVSALGNLIRKEDFAENIE